MSKTLHIHTPPKLQEAINEFHQAYFVGGCVRDAIIGMTPKDLDIEVHNTPLDTVITKLSKHGKVNLAGVSFQVVKLTINGEGTFDFSIPRRDNKTSEGGHRGFTTTADPTMGIKEASRRRDFTVNAIAVCTKTQEIHDPFNGLDDLNNGILRAVDPKTFAEDPLRVLRGVQFSARFGLQMDPETQKLCQNLLPEFDSLAKERIWEEWNKLATKSTLPSAGIQTLIQTGWITKFPEIDGMEKIPQNPTWHPEGNVLNHTLHCMDALVCEPQWQELPDDRKAILFFAILCHDIGKKTHTQINEKTGKITSIGHEKAGVDPTKTFLERIGTPKKWIPAIQKLVLDHMLYLRIDGKPENKRIQKVVLNSVRSLHEQGTNLKELFIIMKADHSGRPPLPQKLPKQAEILLEVAQNFNILEKNPVCLIQGKDLQALGFPPGPNIGKLLKATDEAHLNHGFTSKEETLAYFKNHVVELHSKAGIKPKPWVGYAICNKLCNGENHRAGLLYKEILSRQILQEVKSPEEALKLTRKRAKELNQEPEIQ